MKIKMSVTLDEDLKTWVENHEEFRTSSECINHFIRRAWEGQSDIFHIIKEIEYQQGKLLEKKKKEISKLKTVIEEGNKKEREEALKLLEEQKRVAEQEKIKMEKATEEFLNMINEFGLKENFEACTTYEDLKDLITEMAKINFEKYDNQRNIPYGFMTLIFENLIKNKNEKEISA